MHILSGLELPSGKCVLFNGNIISEFTAYEKFIFLNQSIGSCFNSHILFESFLYLKNVMLPGLLSGQSSTECKSRAQELLLQVDLVSKFTSNVATLSGGHTATVLRWHEHFLIDHNFYWLMNLLVA